MESAAKSVGGGDVEFDAVSVGARRNNMVHHSKSWEAREEELRVGLAAFQRIEWSSSGKQLVLVGTESFLMCDL